MEIIIFSFATLPTHLEIIVLDVVSPEIMILDFVSRVVDLVVDIVNLEFQIASKTKSLALILKILGLNLLKV